MTLNDDDVHRNPCVLGNMNHRTIALGTAVAGLFVLSCGGRTLHGTDQRESETIRYLRVSGSEFVKEFEIQLTQTEQSFVVKSTTQRGEQTLIVSSQFDANNTLVSARVSLRRGERAQSASVRVTNRTARVLRDGNKSDELACPSGVIVTSAPDWTDSFMAVRRYDPKGSATQTFPGLWIHPTREPLELTIKLTRLGHDSVMLRNKSTILDRFLLVLCGGSRYIVWRNQQGQLVRLVHAMEGNGGIVLTGWERATRNLKPRVSRD